MKFGEWCETLVLQEPELRKITDTTVIVERWFKHLKMEDENKVCWSCGHWLIGGGCWKDGVNNRINTDVDYSCEAWLEEDTPGTITHEVYNTAIEELFKEAISKGKVNEKNIDDAFAGFKHDLTIRQERS
ncbi:hypothetical protein IC620_15420 [Hazenella sp. IB182357]|uniref:Uncharacterized protein n=1 Tax=Polycladospora coralii TaxID=2771432 RepID=A0A926NDC7_9BACL|nr:hypothetical protein [Polycladospora coralii]MBD1373735.1 hypothetical protein [Polycladospora coralii]